jgi:hypothetical protein
MFNWFFNLVAARSTRATKARVAKLARMVQLTQSVQALHTARNGTTPAQTAVLHAAGAVRAVSSKKAA